ncbi:MAG: NAD-dependent epimerase/dehydratase family protein [bacterium]|nr:NAD-dependent epimerase/dehydratase family protein [bacterium]
MKVLVTGGAGYIGSNVVKVLLDAGHQVVVFDNLSTGNAKALSDVSLFTGDILNKSDLITVFSATQFDALIHSAAKVKDDAQSNNPELIYQNNVAGALNVFEIARKYNVKRIIYTSSSDVYGKTSQNTCNEDSSPAPLSTYGKSKAMVETVLRDYFTAYDTSVVILRCFTTAGGPISGMDSINKPNAGHLIDSLIDAYLNKTPLILNTSLSPTSNKTNAIDYIHVTDVAKAHLLSLEHTKFETSFEVFNVCSGKTHSAEEVVNLFNTLFECDIKIEKSKNAQPVYYPPESSFEKIKNILAWSPRYSDLSTILQTSFRNRQKTHQQN